jgi:Uma2 family endonuclease
LRGVLVEMSPQKAPHAVVVERLNYLLLPAVGARGRVRIQLPLALSDDSEPEPDVAVVPSGDYSRAHPTTALLLVEVSYESRRIDRGVKRAIYAEAGIPEYWIADVIDGVLEVHRRPVDGTYRDVARHDRAAVVALVAFPDVRIAVADVLSPPTT